MSWSDCLLDPVNCVVGSVGENAATSVWETFVKWLADGLADLSSTVFRTFSESTSPRFDQAWWRQNLDLMVKVSLPLLVIMFILQCMSAAIRREPGRLAHAVVGALVGTAGVPLAVGVTASCGRAVDEISSAILGTRTTAEGLKRMVDLGALLTTGSFGGFLITVVLLGWISIETLYFVMLFRQVALIAFVVFAPIAMVSWTWSATRHWLRRWIEIVGALLFSKIAMAVVFALGISAFGVSGQGDKSNIGTFMAGILLIAMAAFAPLATFSFIHWVGDHGQAATQMVQQARVGADVARDRLDQAQQWRADQFGGGSEDDDSASVVGDSSTEEAVGNDPTDSGWSSGPDGGAESPDSPSSGTAGEGTSAIAVATGQVSVDGADSAGVQPGTSGGNATPDGGKQ